MVSSETHFMENKCAWKISIQTNVYGKQEYVETHYKVAYCLGYYTFVVQNRLKICENNNVLYNTFVEASYAREFGSNDEERR